MTGPSGLTGGKAQAMDIEQVGPLAPMQEGMWFHAKLSPDDDVYVEQVTGLVEGKLDVRAFRQAWSDTVAHHSALRASFHEAADQPPVQRIHRQVEIPWVEDDWRGYGAAEQQNRLTAFLRGDREAGFDLERAPLMRFALFLMEKDATQLVWTHHHLLLDGWSVALLLQEVAERYRAACDGRVIALPAAPAYQDYLDWLGTQNQAEAERYWRGELTGFRSPTPLPLTGGAAYRADGAARRVERLVGTAELAPEVTRILQDSTSRHGITAGTMVHAAWALLLSRYSGEPEVVHGMTMSVRPPELPGVGAMIGLLINTVPVRLRIDPRQSARAWLSKVQDRLLEARGHGNLSLARVQGWADVPAGTALFESLVVHENYPMAPPGSSGGPGALKIRRTVATERSNYPVSVVAVPGPPFTLRLIFDSGRLAPGDAQTVLGDLARLLAALAAAPEALIADLPFPTADRVGWQTAMLNPCGSPYPRGVGLHRLFAEQAVARSDGIALVEGERQYSYGHLATQAERVARMLRAHSIPIGGRVGIALPRCAASVRAVLGIARIGCAYVPLDPGYPVDRLSFMVKDSGLDAIVTDSAHFKQCPSDSLVPVLDLDNATGVEPSMPLPPAGPSTGGGTAAYVMYTSGSTGVPKGIAVQQRAVTRLVRDTDYIQLHASIRMCHAANTSFDAATFEIWGALLNGAALVVLEDDEILSPERFARGIREQAVTTAFLTTALFQQIAAWQPTAFASLDDLLFGGEQVDPRLVSAVLRQGGPGRLLHVYGPTESTTFALWHHVQRQANGSRSVPIGRPLANTTAYVLDETGRQVPPGAAGELYLGGDGLAYGYPGHPALTAERFLPDPFGPPGGRLYRTGDKVRIAADGVVTFLGRVDRQVKLRGYRIEPGEIEQVVRAHPTVCGAVVRLRERGSGDKRLDAYVVLSSESDRERPGAGELRAHCADRLPKFMVPSTFTVLESLPLTPNGKTDYAALPEPDRGSAQERDPGRPATVGAAESLLAGIWQQVTGVERVDAQDDFFDLGGHSLLAVRVQNRVREVFGVEITLRTIFSETTLRRLAAAIVALRDPATLEAGSSDDPLPELTSGPESEPAPLAFAQQRLWFLERWQSGTSLYHISGAVRLRGPLHVGALRGSWRRLVDRHEMLRTRIDDSDGQEPVQVLLPADPTCQTPVVDLSGLPKMDGAARAQALCQTVVDAPFDLTAGPLWRVVLLRRAADDHVLALALHHLIADGDSLALLLDELGAGYQAMVMGREPPFLPLAVRFADYARWQRSWLGSSRLRSELDYWKRQLAGLSTITLPTDRIRQEHADSTADLVREELGAQAERRLTAVGLEVGATSFMVFLAVFALALGHNRRMSQVVVGTPIAGRGRAELENVIGFFANTLVLRIDLSDDPTFRELLVRTREVCLDAYAHQDVPFDRVVQELAPERSESHLPLFQTWFVVQDAPQVAQVFPGLEVEPIGLRPMPARYDLRLDIQRFGPSLRAVFEYKTDLFERPSISRLGRHFARLLEVAAIEPDSQLSVLTRQVGAADERARQERRGSVSLSSLNRLRTTRRGAADDIGTHQGAQGEGA